MNSMDFLKSFISTMGSSGYPLAFKEEYAPTWDAFCKTYPNPTSMRERVLQVLNFMQYMQNAGIKLATDLKLKLPIRFTPKDMYAYLVQLEIESVLPRFKEVTRKLQLNGLLVTKYRKLFVVVDDKIRISYALALAPKRNESLDSVLFKLCSGGLFPEVPEVLKEKYKKSNNARTAAKSAHAKYSSLFTNPSNVGRFPLFIDSNQTITLSRSAESLLVLRFQFEFPKDSLFWLTRAATVNLWQHTFKKVLVK